MITEANEFTRTRSNHTSKDTSTIQGAPYIHTTACFQQALSDPSEDMTWYVGVPSATERTSAKAHQIAKLRRSIEFERYTQNRYSPLTPARMRSGQKYEKILIQNHMTFERESGRHLGNQDYESTTTTKLYSHDWISSSLYTMVPATHDAQSHSYEHMQLPSKERMRDKRTLRFSSI
ncbi:hypothetical protein BJ508DRAFT_312764 [Ascobolus immersus RN42]|uniref:Uncharacterized protein n=1 Tax=Ascobolus immersus RN42 TaxID=1160509 RepID=A0A3N4HL39_ASCIM|nr:hypothetical protein BJ508DRAFT_312764 [Ascobolus immersus RN42]